MNKAEFIKKYGWDADPELNKNMLSDLDSVIKSESKSDENEK